MKANKGKRQTTQQAWLALGDHLIDYIDQLDENELEKLSEKWNAVADGIKADKRRMKRMRRRIRKLKQDGERQ